MKKAVILTTILFITIQAKGQKSKNAYFEDYKVRLDLSNQINQSHPYFEHLSQQDELYITWFYANNKKNMKNTPQYADPAVIVSDQDANNSLIFELTNDYEVKYDTIRNSIHDLRKEHDNPWAIFDRLRDRFSAWHSFDGQDLKGDLPKGSMMWLESKKWGLDFGVLVPKPESHVLVVIKNRKGENIATIIDEQLHKGWNNFKWKRGQNKRGRYNIIVTIDGKTMSQNFKS